MDSFNQYVDKNQERFVAILQRMCCQPSVAAQDVKGKEMRKMARMVKKQLKKISAKCRLIDVKDSPPVIYAALGEGKRTLLIYNHYDVQPPEPLEEWQSDPFRAEIREGKIFARGVSDNKGNLMARIFALEAWQETFGELPLKVKFIVEGEEEVGSCHLPQFVEENKDLLKGVDGCLWETGGVDKDERPVIVLGTKGVLGVKLLASGAKRDQHSANAAILPSPIWRLIWALNTLKNEKEEILIEGFNELIAKPKKDVLKLAEKIPYDEEWHKQKFGVSGFLCGAKGNEIVKRYIFEPTCNILGIESGYTGEGIKTVLPAKAWVKLDFRLVPNQTGAKVFDLLKKHLERKGFEDIEVTKLDGTNPARTDPQALVVKAAVAAAEKVYKKEPIVYPNAGWSGPMEELCQRQGIPVVSAGIGYPESHTHAPNENMRLSDYIIGIKYIGEFIKRFAETSDME